MKNGRKTVVQSGRSRMQQEMAEPTWTASPATSDQTALETEDAQNSRNSLNSQAAQKKTDDQNSQTARAKTLERKPVQTIAVAQAKKKLRVAGYCRVSTSLDSQEMSIESQRNHYRDYILSNPDWELAGIYWETGISGTKAETRPELQRLLADCAAHRVDLVITKSISRFSRNVTDCLEMVRSLMALNVTLWFEKENIRTDRMESELLLSILAAFAADESRSISENMKWGIRKRFEAGTYRAAKAPYGYRKENNEYVIDPAEAEVIRGIFHAVLSGTGCSRIAKDLNEQGVPTWSSANESGETKWSAGTVRGIIRNGFYTGDSLYQKTFMDHQYRQRKNRGELDQYLDEEAHPAIIDRETHRKANEIIRHHAREQGADKAGFARQNRYCFSGKVVCACCGKTMLRAMSRERPVYHCEADCHNNAYVDGMQNAFATMLNKLAFAEGSGIPILEAYVSNGAGGAETDGAETDGAEMDGVDGADCMSRSDGPETEKQRLRQLLKVNERKQAALHDRAIAECFTAELRRKKAALDTEEHELLMALESLEAGNQDITEFRKAIQHRGIQPAFTDADDAIFRNYVEKAVASPDDMEVHFTFGLVVKEPIRLPTVRHNELDDSGGKER